MLVVQQAIRVGQQPDALERGCDRAAAEILGAYPQPVGIHVGEDLDSDLQIAGAHPHCAAAACDVQLMPEQLGTRRIEAENERAAREGPRVGLAVVLGHQRHILAVPRILIEPLILRRDGGDTREDLPEGANPLLVGLRDANVPDVVVAKVDHDRVGPGCDNRAQRSVAEQRPGEEIDRRTVVDDRVTRGALQRSEAR